MNRCSGGTESFSYSAHSGALWTTRRGVGISAKPRMRTGVGNNHTRELLRTVGGSSPAPASASLQQPQCETKPLLLPTTRSARFEAPRRTRPSPSTTTTRPLLLAGRSYAGLAFPRRRRGRSRGRARRFSLGAALFDFFLKGSMFPAAASFSLWRGRSCPFLLFPSVFFPIGDHGGL